MEHNWKHIFRMRSHFRNVGLVVTVFFAVIGIVSVLAAYFNVDGSFARPKLTALIFVICWSAFEIPAIWLLLLHSKYRLFVNDSSFRQRGVLRDDQIDWHLVNELKWQDHPPGGSVRMSGMFGVLKIELANFETDDRENVITFIRQAVAETRQYGWQEFNDHFADTPGKRERSRRAQISHAFLFVAMTVGFLITGTLGNKPELFVMSAVNAVITAYLFWTCLHKQTKPVTDDGDQSGDVCAEKPSDRLDNDPTD